MNKVILTKLDDALETCIAATIEAIDLKNNKNNVSIPCIFGEPGIGKSSFVKDMCEKRGWHFFELLCNQLGDRADLTGCRTVSKDENINGQIETIWKQVFFPHVDVQEAITCAKNNPDDIVVLFLDELNRTTADITSAILSFSTARKIGSEKFPTNIRFIVAGNDKGNVTALDTASITRFVTYYAVADADRYMSIEVNLNKYVKDILIANPELIFCTSNQTTVTGGKSDDGDDYGIEYDSFDDEAEGFTQITTPRTISGLNAFLNRLSGQEITQLMSVVLKDASGNDCTMLSAAIRGFVGNTLFAEKIEAAIAEDVRNGNFNKAMNTVLMPQKPANYSKLKKCKTVSDRNAIISAMSADELSHMLIYLLSQNDDNSDIIEAIAAAMDRNNMNNLVINDIGILANMLQNSNIDEDNFKTLATSDTKVGQYISGFFGNAA